MAQQDEIAKLREALKQSETETSEWKEQAEEREAQVIEEQRKADTNEQTIKSKDK